MKACPMCAEEIQDAALVCRHCGARATATGWVTGAGPAGARSGVNGFAIASMVLGILWIYWVGSILALVFGYVARNQIKRSMGTQGGNGMAVAGIVLGWIGIGTLLLLIVVGIASSGS